MDGQNTIYLVDDDSLILETLHKGFRDAGFEVHPFSDAEIFLETPLITERSCLLLDLHMPRVTGLELQQKLQAQGIEIPVIIYTGNADVMSAVKTMEYGAVTLIQKPVSIDYLITKVKQAIERHQAWYQKKARRLQAAERLNQLSRRERDVARLVADGYSAANVADRLFISQRTVEAHKGNIFTKLGIKSTANLTQLVMLAEWEQNDSH